MYVCVSIGNIIKKASKQVALIKKIKKRSKPYSQKQAKLLHIAHKSHL